MSLTVISEPGYLSLSKNPVEFHLRSDAYVNQQPVVGVWELSFSTKLTTLASLLTLEFDGHSVDIYVESTTTPSGYNLPQDITSTTLTQYVTALAETWFPAQYLLEKYFIIEYAATNKVRFTAKSAETTLTATTTIPGGEATWATTTPPIALGTLNDYTVIMDIEVEEEYGSDEWTRIGPVHGDPLLYDDSGTWKGDVKIDVSELLHGFLQDRQDPPTLGSTTPVIADNTNLQWRAVYAERYTVVGEVVIARRVQTDSYRVLKGGLNYLDVPALPDLETDFYGVTEKPFNTWQPQNKEVTPNEPHFLYYLTDYDLTGMERFRLQATVYYTDGTTQSTNLQDVTTQEEFETFIYAAGFEEQGLDALSALEPYKYELSITVNPLNPITTVTRTFYLVGATRQDRFFLFENSMGGGWDTLRTNGEWVSLSEPNKTEAKKVVQAGYAATEANIVQRSQGYQDSCEVFIGPKAKNEQKWLRDFMNAERHYEIIDGTLVPIVVDNQKWKLEYEKTGSYTYVESFKYRYAFMNKGYSNA